MQMQRRLRIAVDAATGIDAIWSARGVLGLAFVEAFTSGDGYATVDSLSARTGHHKDTVRRWLDTQVIEGRAEILILMGRRRYRAKKYMAERTLSILSDRELI